MSVNPIRVFVCGGHDFQDMATVRRVLDAVQDRTGVATLLEGGDGVGLMAAEWAVSRAVPVLTLRRSRREVELHDRDAQVRRIIGEGQPDFVIGFPGGHRTASLLDRLERAGIRVYRVPKPGQEPLLGHTEPAEPSHFLPRQCRR